MPNVQRVGRGVEAAVGRDGRAAGLEEVDELLLGGLGREHLLEQTALVLGG